MKFIVNREKDKLQLVEADRVEFFQLKLHLTRYSPGYQYDKRFIYSGWDGTISHFHDGNIDLGLWNECRKFCERSGYEFQIENPKDLPINKDVKESQIVEFCQQFYRYHKTKDGKDFFPYEHQINSVFKVLRYPFSNIEVATRGGKSLIFSTWVFWILKHVNPDAKFMLIVPTISLVKQFYNDITNYNRGFNENDPNPERCDLRISEMMSSKPRVHENPNLLIGTYQSLKNLKKADIIKYQYFVADEAHGSKAATLQRLMKNTFGHAKARWGMSGTFPGAETLDILTIQAVTGPIVTKVEAYELQEKGIISKVQIKALILNHSDPKFHDNLQIMKKAGRGREVLDLEKEYVQKSKARIDFICDKILSKVTKNTLLLFHNIEYGKKMYNLLRDRLQFKDIYYIDGGTEGEKRMQIQRTMEDTTGNPKILVASYGTFSTGITISSLTNVILADSFKSEQIVIQSIGRSLGLHDEKDCAQIFDIVDVFRPEVATNKSKGRRVGVNTLYRHYLERQKFYDKRRYPNSRLLVNLKN